MKGKNRVNKKKRVKTKKRVKKMREKPKNKRAFMLKRLMSRVLFIQTNLYLYFCTKRYVLILTNLKNLYLVWLFLYCRNMRRVTNDVPSELPPISGIEHQIDFVPGATIPNRLAYRSNPKETKEL